MKIAIKRVGAVAIAAYLSILPSSAFALTLYNPLGTRSVPQIIGFVIQAALGICGSIALVMLVYGGFLWLTSGGKPESIKKGQQTIVWSILGITLIFGANALATFVITNLGAATAAA